MHWLNVALTLSLTAIFTTILAIFINMNWNVVVTWNSKAIWLFVLTFFTSIGFYVKRQETNSNNQIMKLIKKSKFCHFEPVIFTHQIIGNNIHAPGQIRQTANTNIIKIR